MRYYRVYDDITPEGQEYRAHPNGDLETVNVEEMGWEASIFDSVEELVSIVGLHDGRVEEVFDVSN